MKYSFNVNQIYLGVVIRAKKIIRGKNKHYSLLGRNIRAYLYVKNFNLYLKVLTKFLSYYIFNNCILVGGMANKE